MRKDLGIKTWVLPCPVLMIATFDDNGVPDIMNAAWGGTADTNKICICLSMDHKTTKNILLNKEFAVSFGTLELVKECDYLGLVSGNDIDNKLNKVGLTYNKSKLINAPIVDQFKLTLECRLNKIYEDEGLIIGDIININIDDSILDEKGNIDFNKYIPISYNPINHTYMKVNEVVGKAFFDGLVFKK